LFENDESILLSRCQTGDKEAFRILIGQHRCLLFGTAYLMTHDRDLAEDAIQEALIQIWKKLPSLHFQASLKSWMVRIVVNEVKQQFRKKRLNTVPLEQAFDLTDTSIESEMSMMRNEDHRCLREALELLSSEHREAVVLRYYADLTVPEISAVLNQPEGTIKSRLSRALNRLEEILRHNANWEGGK